MTTVFRFVLLMMLVWGCKGEKQPKDMIEKEKFEAIYVELLDSASRVEKDSADVTMSPPAARILKRHQVSVDQLKATVNYYNADTKRWRLFYEDVVKRVNEQSLKNTTR